jgi:predicted O-methyltransferase YrrM
MAEDAQARALAGTVVDKLAGIEESFRVAKLTLLAKEAELFKPLFEKRARITQAIPRFWATVLSAENELSDVIGTEELDLLKSCLDLRIDRGDDPRDFVLTLKFARNSYLADDCLVLQKAFKFDGGALRSVPVAIKWKQGKDIVDSASKQDRLSFFSLFGFTHSHEFAEPDGEADYDEEEDAERLAALRLEDLAIQLAEEVFPHALSYFTDALAPDEEEDKKPTTGSSTPGMVPESMTTSFLDLQQLHQQSAHPASISPGKESAGAWKGAALAQNAAAVEHYAAAHSSPALSGYLMKHREESSTAFGDRLMITNLQAQMLMFLISSHRFKDVLEIGTFTGFSALCFAEAGAEKILTLESDEQHASFAKLAIHAAGKSDVIRVLRGDAHALLRDKQQVGGRDQYDFIFIDAEKSGYQDYLVQILERKLLKAHGLIVCDNTLRRGAVAIAGLPTRSPAQSLEDKRKGDAFDADVEAIRRFNTFIAGHVQLSSVLLPIFDGLTLIRYR